MDLAAERPAPARSLAPREHGAWGQLGVPLAASLSVARPTAAGVALALSAVALFAAHEPLLVALGHRGPRALREDGPRARRRLAALSAVGASLGLAGLAAAPGARVVCALPLALAAAVGAFIARRAERTALGVTTAAAALAAASAPVMIASGVPVRTALWAWAAWAVGFALVTPAVRGAIAHARAPSPLAQRAVALVPPLAALVALAVVGPAWSALGACPFALAAFVLVIAPPSPRHLKRVGWALVASSLAAGAALVVALRTS
ncbi:MAG: YwiC-like family protein [Polyangiales bacterium]